MEGIPVGCPLFEGSEEEFVSPCYLTLRLGADVTGQPLDDPVRPV